MSTRRDRCEAFWEFRYPTDFEDRYGYNNGPRSSPVIDGDRVFTVGAQGQLHCLNTQTGRLIWRRHLASEYKVPQDFFGTASTPLVEGVTADRQCRRTGWPMRRRARQDDRPRSLARRKGVGTELRITSPRPSSMESVACSSSPAASRRRQAAGLLSIDPANGRDRLRVSVAQPIVRISQRVLPRRLRQQGLYLGELSNGRRAGRNAARFHTSESPGRRRSSACISTRRFIETVTCTGSTAATSPMHRSPASMPRREKSSGASFRSGTKC